MSISFRRKRSCYGERKLAPIAHRRKLQLSTYFGVLRNLLGVGIENVVPRLNDMHLDLSSKVVRHVCRERENLA
jgi:hypothetical protein